MPRIPNGLRLPLILAGLLLIILGYAVMAIPPETALDIVSRRVFMGIGLTFVGGLTVVFAIMLR